ncbi:MAG: virulence factor BrkB family protein [Pseudomonadota bacterium]
MTRSKLTLERVSTWAERLRKNENWVGVLINACWQLIEFIGFVWHRFVEDKGLQSASALSYTTLLSLVPLMTVIFMVFSAFPAFKSLEADIQNFIFSNFVPAAGETVRDYLQTFAEKSAGLTTIGICFLIVTALMMIQTIDVALNNIWRAQKTRNLMRNFTIYWSLLTLSPVLLGAGMFLSSYLMSLSWLAVEQSIWQVLLGWLPFLTTTIAFTLMYLIVPNRSVPWLPAVVGGILAAITFEAAKKGFAVYVTQSNSYETVYGALSTIPIFLGWIYISWVIILLGAEITCCLTIFKRAHWQKQHELHDNDTDFITAYRLLGHFWQAQRDGESLSIENMLLLENREEETRLLNVLIKLEQSKWLHRTSEGSWILARDLSEVSLLNLYRGMMGGLIVLPKSDDEWSRRLNPLLIRLNQSSEETLNVTLKDLYSPTVSEQLPQNVVAAPINEAVSKSTSSN